MQIGGLEVQNRNHGAKLTLECMLGSSGRRRVAIGFASASALRRASFADVLNETTGEGYQRRFNTAHSLDFRRYLQTDGGTSTPLIFNLRSDQDHAWSIRETEGGRAEICIPRDGQALSQVDCQHRLGHLSDVALPLPFMIYIGLTVREELELFNTINGKSKGLSGSLLRLHEANLVEDAVQMRPDLFIALRLVHDPLSPWHRRVDLGGDNTSGLQRRASLVTIQNAVSKFLNRSGILKDYDHDAAATTARDFWRAVVMVLPDAWSNPRGHVLTKGVGVYALMEVAADIYIEGGRPRQTEQLFLQALADFAPDFDWSTKGPLKGFGGQAGAKEAAALIRGIRDRRRLKVVADG